MKRINISHVSIENMGGCDQSQKKIKKIKVQKIKSVPKYVTKSHNDDKPHLQLRLSLLPLSLFCHSPPDVLCTHVRSPGRRAMSMVTSIVRATLPPSTLFADRALLCRGYSISAPNA